MPEPNHINLNFKDQNEYDHKQKSLNISCKRSIWALVSQLRQNTILF
jgi:hypothetical protein